MLAAPASSVSKRQRGRKTAQGKETPPGKKRAPLELNEEEPAYQTRVNRRKVPTQSDIPGSFRKRGRRRSETLPFRKPSSQKPLRLWRVGAPTNVRFGGDTGTNPGTWNLDGHTMEWATNSGRDMNTIVFIHDDKQSLTDDEIGFLMDVLGRTDLVGPQGNIAAIGGAATNTHVANFHFTRFTHLVITGRTLANLPGTPDRRWSRKEVYALCVKVMLLTNNFPCVDRGLLVAAGKVIYCRAYSSKKRSEKTSLRGKLFQTVATTSAAPKYSDSLPECLYINNRRAAQLTCGLRNALRRSRSAYPRRRPEDAFTTPHHKNSQPPSLLRAHPCKLDTHPSSFPACTTTCQSGLDSLEIPLNGMAWKFVAAEEPL